MGTDRPPSNCTPSRFISAAALDFHVHAMDVDQAFLQGDLKEEIYMEPPRGGIMYLIMCTRPDIAHPVSVLSKFIQDSVIGPGPSARSPVASLANSLRSTSKPATSSSPRAGVGVLGGCHD